MVKLAGGGSVINGAYAVLFLLISQGPGYPHLLGRKKKKKNQLFSRKDMTQLTPYSPEDLQYAGFFHTNMNSALKVEILPALHLNQRISRNHHV